MIRHIFAIFLMALTATAESAQKAHTSTPRPIGARQNLTWSPMPYDESVDHLPAGYFGTDPFKFYVLFKSRAQMASKGEFETSNQFAERTADLDQILAPISTKISYAFMVESFQPKYDADTESFTFNEFTDSYRCHPSGLAGLNREFRICNIALINMTKDQYKGSNSFGVSRLIKRIRGINFSIALPSSHAAIGQVFTRPSSYFDDITFSDKLHVPLEKAKALKGKIGVLFVGAICDTKLIEGQPIITEPTISNPRDVIIETTALPFDLKRIVYYVISTGEILEQRVIE